jgi:hypothetical protein
VERLDRLTLAWYDVGSCGAFGGRLHFGSEMEWEEDERAFEFWVDMGTAGEPAIEALVKVLACFAENEGVEFEKLVIGFPGDRISLKDETEEKQRFPRLCVSSQ